MDVIHRDNRVLKVLSVIGNRRSIVGAAAGEGNGTSPASAMCRADEGTRKLFRV